MKRKATAFGVAALYGWSPSALAEGRPLDRIELKGGLAVSFADDDLNSDKSGNGQGVWLESSYVRPLSNWFEPSLYGGVVATFDSEQGCEGCEASTRALFVGGQARLKIPVPYVAPFMDLGIGLTGGHFRTLAPGIDRELTGVALHLPVSLGLVLGKESPFEIAFRYLFVPQAQQVAGAIAVGVSWPIE